MIYAREVLKSKKIELLTEKQRIINSVKNEAYNITNNIALNLIESRVKDIDEAIKLIEKVF